MSMVKLRAVSRDSWSRANDCFLGDGWVHLQCQVSDESRVLKVLGGSVQAMVS